MSNLIYDYRVPDSYTRLDDRTTTQDHYFNVHDLRKGYDNHNILIARKLRRTVVTMGQNVNLASSLIIRSDLIDALPQLEIPIRLSPYVKSLNVNMYGRRVTSNVNLYFSFDSQYEKRPIDSDVKIAATATSNVNHTVNVPIPREAAREHYGILRIYAATPYDSSALKTSGSKVLAVSNNAIQINDSGVDSADVGSVLLLGSDATGSFVAFSDIRPKLITSISHEHPNGSHGSGNEMHTIQFVGSLERLPDIEDLFYEIRNTSYFASESLSVYENITSATSVATEPVFNEVVRI